MSTAWYFAYGSNMQSATLRGRRGIEYRRALPGRVSGWRLVLDKPPLFPVGGAYANIVADPTAEVLGVLYEIAAADLEHIDLSEAVPLGNYRRISVVAQALQAGDTVDAHTLTSELRDPALQPTTRYMSLLIEGAREHGLPVDYVDYLRTVPSCVETPEAEELRPLIDRLMRRPER